MKRVLGIFLLCLLLIGAHSADDDPVEIKVQCKANDTCSTKFEYIYTKGTNVTFSVCAEEACDAGSFQLSILSCDKGFNAADCASKYCLTESATCADQNANCPGNQPTATYDCKACSTNDICSDDTTTKGNCLWSGSTEGSCITSGDCPYTKYTDSYEDCTSDTFGGACKCCLKKQFTDLKESGICIDKDINWLTDQFQKTFKAEDSESFNTRELSQVMLLAIVGLFLSFNAL